MSLVPYAGMVDAALKLKNDLNLWVAIGQTTAWANEAAPPAEDINAQTVSGVVVYKRVETTSVCVPDLNGLVVFQTQKYTLIQDINALSAVARYTYLKTSLNYTEVPVVTFRQVGVFSGLVPSAGFTTADILLPTQIVSPGRLLFVANDIPRVRSINTRDIIEIIREFKS